MYAIIDVLSGPDHPVISTREWIAGRLGASDGGVAKAIASLTAHHAGGPLTPEIAPLITSRPRGKGLSAERATAPHIPFVDVPEWTIGDDSDGPLVEHQALRLYAVMMAKRAPGRPWCALKRADLAQLVRCRPDTIPVLTRQLEAAGMVVCVDRPGDTTIYLPLLTQEADGAVHAEIADAIRIACTHPVDRPVAPLASDDAPHASTGSAVHASTGSDPRPSPGSANKGSDLEGRDLLDPRVAAPAPCGAGGPADTDVVQLVSERQRRQQTVEAYTAAADTRASIRAAAAAAAAKYAETRSTPTGGLAALVAAVEDLESDRRPGRLAS